VSARPTAIRGMRLDCSTERTQSRNFADSWHMRWELTIKSFTKGDLSFLIRPLE
jgi:hypothetical protein